MGAPLVPVVFRKSPGYNVQYDWLDATTGAGYRRYYACCADLTPDSAAEKFLTTRTLDSEPWFIALAKNNGAYTLDIDYDFDITFQLPATIAASTAYVQALRKVTSADMDSYLVINIYHVTAAAVETLIGTATTEAWAGGTDAYMRDIVPVTLTKKLFGIGEKLRLNVQVYTLCNPAGAETITLYFDPSSREVYDEYNGATSGTDLTFDVPFEIDL